MWLLIHAWIKFNLCWLVGSQVATLTVQPYFVPSKVYHEHNDCLNEMCHKVTLFQRKLSDEHVFVWFLIYSWLIHASPSPALTTICRPCEATCVHTWVRIGQRYVLIIFCPHSNIAESNPSWHFNTGYICLVVSWNEYQISLQIENLRLYHLLKTIRHIICHIYLLAAFCSI